MKKTFLMTKTVTATMTAGVIALAMFRTPSAQAQTNIDDLQKQIQTLRQTLDEMRRSPGTNTTAPSADVPSMGTRRNVNTNDPIERIRDEGLNRSEVMKTLGYLSDVIGARLTGSPNMKHANEWTRQTLESWGLSNAHLESWGPFGRGWELKRFSAQVIEPQDIPLKAFPSAWSPGFEEPIEANVVYFNARTDADLEQYKGKLKGAIVLTTPIRELTPHFEAQSRRLEETNLLDMANADLPGPPQGQFGGPGGQGGQRGRRGGAGGRGGVADGATNAPTGGLRFTGTADAPPPRRGGRGGGATRYLSFLSKEGVAMVVNPSTQGDGGTIYAMSAAATPPENQNTNAPGGPPPRIQAYSTNSPSVIPQMTVAVEEYNRMLRMLDAGEKLKMAVDLKVKFHTSDPMSYNTIAEIPGTDLKNEIVMVGGHMDSWQSGTGATDNGAGVAAAMEAVRIIKALDLKPRRTIRVALWSGEEEGLLGSKAYVAQHFGYFTNTTPVNTNTEAITATTRSPRDAADESDTAPRRVTNRRGRGGNGGGANSNRKLVKGDEYEKLSAYFNLDNGAGRIRGVYMQGNEAVRPLFRKWLDPFRDLGAETLTPQNTGSTDHISFDTIGLPGFQFIQDPLEYNTRTHHSNEDVFDRVPAEDMKQCATIMAAFVYQAAMMDEKLPRKPVE